MVGLGEGKSYQKNLIQKKFSNEKKKGGSTTINMRGTSVQRKKIMGTDRGHGQTNKNSTETKIARTNKKTNRGEKRVSKNNRITAI